MADTALNHQERLAVRRISMRLTKEFPFFGHVFACCRFVRSKEVETAGLLVDECLTVRLGDKFFDKEISYTNQRFIMLHEVAHFLFQHPTRAGKQLTDVKNLAMDLAVNSFLQRHSSLPLPEHALTPSSFNLDWDRTYEWYLHQLMKQQHQKEGNGGGNNGNNKKQQGKAGDGKGDGKGDNKDKRHGAGQNHKWEIKVSETEAEELSGRLYATAKAAGTDPGGALGELYKVRAEVDWKLEFLRAAQRAELSEEWTFTKRRFSKRYDTIPGVIHDYLGKLFLIVDTSGSMGPKEIGACFNVVEQLARIGYLIHIFEVDAKLQREYVYEGTPPKVKGGGGTMFQTSFAHIAENYPECEQIICLTDGYVGDLHHGPPDPEIVWVLTPDAPDNMPWGHTIRMKLNSRTMEY